MTFTMKTSSAQIMNLTMMSSFLVSGQQKALRRRNKTSTVKNDNVRQLPKSGEHYLNKKIK